MTYIQLVNRVLTRLREKTVNTPTENEYSALVGAYINEAKEQVESAWAWRALRREITFPTVSGTNDYNLGAGGVATGGTTTEDSILLLDKDGLPCLWNTTLRTRLSQSPLETLRDWKVTVPANAQPDTFAVLRASTGLTLRFVPAPDAVYAIMGVFLIPQDDLSASTDVLTVPSEPVWKLALAMAADERGTGMGETPETLLRRADQSLANAILDDGELSDFTAVAI